MSSNYWLRIYRDQGFEVLLAEFPFNGEEEFVTWPSSADNQISSFKFSLPEGWEMLFYLDPNPESKPTKGWIGTGEVEAVDAGMLGSLEDDVSAHKWVKSKTRV